MSRRGVRDVAVCGGGVVGAACALALARLGMDVVLVEARPPAAWDAAAPDLRVYAFAHDNARLLETVVLVFESGEEMVIHAMPARKKYLDLLP